MIFRSFSVGDLLDDIVEQIPHATTSDQRIDRTARIASAAITTVQAVTDEPLESLRTEARARLSECSADVLPELDLQVTCATALFTRVLNTLAESTIPMAHGRCSATWLLLAGAARDLRTLAHLATAPVTDVGSTLALASLRAHAYLSDHVAQTLELAPIDIPRPPTPITVPLFDNRHRSERSDLNRVVRSVLGAAHTDALTLGRCVFDLETPLGGVDYGREEAVTLAQAWHIVDILAHATEVLGSHLDELYCDSRWIALADEILEAIGDVRERVWARPAPGAP